MTTDTVASDLSTFTKYWGIDLRSTWLEQDNVDKKTLWNFLNLVESDVDSVKTALGVNNPEQVSLSVQLDDTTEEILQAISESKVSIQGTRGYNLEHIVYYVKQSEINTSDMLHEIVDRLRFVTDRIMTMEEALGVGYITDAGSTQYNSYISKVADTQSKTTTEEQPPAEFEDKTTEQPWIIF